MRKNALETHLDKIRKEAHKTQAKNGHFKKMSELGKEKARIGTKKYWADWREFNGLPPKP